MFLAQQHGDIDKYNHVKTDHIQIETDYFTVFLSYLLPIGTPLLWLISIIFILKSEFKNPVDKLIWVLISFIPLIGPILYFTIGRKQKKV